MEISKMPPSWTFEEAQRLINDLEPGLRKIGWVTALTGGVLFKGQSFKDLDLAFYPFDHGNFPDHERTVGGLFKHLRSAGFDESDHDVRLRDAHGFRVSGKRVDVFVFSFHRGA